jgi:hypothetical protein
MRYSLIVVLAIVCGNCGSGPSAAKPAPDSKPKTAAARVTQFYAPDKKIPRGVKGSLCYGVENASKVELTPAVEVLWPSPVRCFEIAPKQNTSYIITAYGEDGSRDTKSVEVTVGSAPPRLYDLSATSAQVHSGEQVVVCFKVENVTSVKAGPGHFDKGANCITDRPKKTTVYKISALGRDNQVDSGSVTVKVR